ncbi:MAG: CPBP family intramembrane metalloprotease [Bacteroidales bacterium]|jgi:membrane protease YdiL (CAAX protease family)|nr:CPBP family intramembrane metalloprotease [Bacteroidales bacterium]
MFECIKNKKQIRWLLYGGLVSLVVGIVMTSVNDVPSDINDNAVLKQVTMLPGWLFFVMVVVFAPLMEEFAFRSWVIGKKWANYLSLVLTSGFMVSVFPSFWVLIVPVLLAINLFAFNKKPVIQMYIYVVLTSLLFSIAHKNNLDFHHYILAFPIYFGLALCLCWLGLRVRFGWCIVAHALYNFTLITLGGFTIATQEPVHLEGKTFKGELKQVSGLKNDNNKISDSLSTRVIDTRVPITQISKMLLGDEKEYKIELYPISYKFYDIDIKSKDTNAIDRKNIIRLLVDKKLIRIDTLKKEKIINIFEQ